MDYPGTPQHQALLRAIVAFYATDPRIAAISVFGSLGRGTWDRLSDLDLDVVTADGVQIAIHQELTALCDSFVDIGEYAALIVPDGEEAGDVVLESLMEFSIRYHPLHATSPNIVDSLHVLAGWTGADVIIAAGQANRSAGDQRSPQQLLDRCIWYAVGVDVALQRNRVWGAIDLMHRMRDLLMELFARTRNRARTYQVFQLEADPELQALLGATLPQYDLLSAQGSLVRLLIFIEENVVHLSNGRVQLSDSQRSLLKQVRKRLARAMMP